MLDKNGRWKDDEHERFLAGLEQHGKNWSEVAKMVRTRTVVQCRSHAQKHFQRVSAENEQRYGKRQRTAAFEGLRMAIPVVDGGQLSSAAPESLHLSAPQHLGTPLAHRDETIAPLGGSGGGGGGGGGGSGDNDDGGDDENAYDILAIPTIAAPLAIRTVSVGPTVPTAAADAASSAADDALAMPPPPPVGRSFSVSTIEPIVAMSDLPPPPATNPHLSVTCSSIDVSLKLVPTSFGLTYGSVLPALFWPLASFPCCDMGV